MKIYFYSGATAVVKDLRGYTLDCSIVSKQCRIIPTGTRIAKIDLHIIVEPAA